MHTLPTCMDPGISLDSCDMHKLYLLCDTSTKAVGAYIEALKRRRSRHGGVAA